MVANDQESTLMTVRIKSFDNAGERWMKDKDINQVLRAWHLAEMISGGEISDAQKDVKWLKGDLPAKIESARQVESNRIKQRNSLVYLGEYRKQDLRDLIQDKLFNDQETVENLDPAIGYSVALVVDDAWHFQKIVVPYAAYFYLCVRENRGKETLTGEKYAEFNEQLQQQLQKIIDNDKLSVMDALARAESVVRTEFKLSSKNEVIFRGILNYKYEPAMLNSFYATDIERVLATENDDEILTAYINGREESHVDIDRNWGFIAPLLTTDNFPDGRWPSPIEFSQSLMQQVAINIICGKAEDKSNLRTVNGPPGTGKTTLLKDVFADKIVEQAKVLAKLTTPADGFKKIGKVELFPNYYYNAYELIPSLQGFGVVVSSSNNAAVANVSKNFPASDEIIQHASGSDEKVNEYLTELQQIDYFSELADQILGGNSWGLFSVPMGSQANQRKVFDCFNEKEAGISHLQHALESAQKESSWTEAKQKFKTAFKKVHEIKQQLLHDTTVVRNYDADKIKNVQKELANLNIQEKRDSLKSKKSELHDKQQALRLLPKRRVLFFWQRETPEREKLKADLSSVYLEKAKLQKEVDRQTHIESVLNRKKQQLIKQAAVAEQLKQQFAIEKTYVANDSYWQGEADQVQRQLPNNSLALQDARAKLFIAAINLRKAFVAAAERPIVNSWKIFQNQEHLIFPHDQLILKSSFQIMQLLIPVMSTTLASVQRMFANFNANTIDNVVIDEAGQATPAAVIGLMWRAKRLLALGDPAQIEPIVTTNEATLRTIAREYGVEEKYLLPTMSVQQLADAGSVYGTYKKDGSWVGIPLWVHRRCDSPMFEIANRISYDNRMVQGTISKRAKPSKWIDSKGKTTQQQFVPQQITDLAKELNQQLKAGKKLADIFVISPFSRVADQSKIMLRQALSESGYSETKVKDWTNKNIGTVHVFQGQEADIVYFVVGTDAASDGSANWAFSKPNLLNVAVTRAKREFYVVGDRQRLATKPYIEVAEKMLH